MTARLFLFIITVFTCIRIAAQAKLSSPDIAGIYCKARAQKDRILLRWAVADPVGWKIGNHYGFTVERYTIVQQGKVNLSKNKATLNAFPLKPKPLVEWEALLEKNDDAAIIAQALYGESFAVSGGDNKLTSIISQHDELNQRFSFSLLAADRNFEAARMAGWGWIDSTAIPGEKYLYRIYTHAPAGKIKSDTTGVFIGLADYQTLPPPKDVNAIYGDKTVMLSWNYRLLKDVYATYYVEKSEDGKIFSSVSDLPVVNLNENEEQVPARMFYTDTLATNGKRYYYRIRGLTTFGETGPYSDTASGEGKQMLAYVPGITNADIVNDSTVLLQWEYPYAGESLLDRFELRQSESGTEKDIKTVIAHISPSERRIRFTQLQPVNYFSIVAIDKKGNERNSFPYLVQPVDSIPPAMPQGVTADIDTLGNVTLSWHQNTEKDLLGYTILKGNIKSEEPAVVNEELIDKNIFREKIDLKTLNSKVYYSVVALDKRMNQSAASAPVELTKPDKIPPVGVMFQAYEVQDDGTIQLAWYSSSSEDVTAYKIYRKEVNAAAWQLVQEISDTTINFFTDKTVVPGQTVSYTILAIDQSGNESLPATPLTVVCTTDKRLPPVRKLRAVLNKEKSLIEISWSYDSQEVAEFVVYRAVNKEQFTVWKITDATPRTLTDHDLMTSNVYKYAVRAALTDGKMSEWVEVKVNF